jgi:hypothetical protein
MIFVCTAFGLLSVGLVLLMAFVSLSDASRLDRPRTAWRRRAPPERPQREPEAGPEAPSPERAPQVEEGP